jgi:diadenosine tetraphosphatase ApaH/serine/threonine PP2A family protein phosphatase
MKVPAMLSPLRAPIKRLLQRLRYDASVRINPEQFDLAPGETRRDVEWIRVQPDVALKVYWKVLPIGKGPAISLYAFEFQILRFDCFGATDGHFHLLLGWPSPTSEDRIWLPEPNATAQVERTMFELKKNVTYYLQRHNDERVRRLRLEPETWSAACIRARDRMLHFLCSVPELADVK